MNTVVDPWRHILESLEPNLVDLNRAMTNGPTIRPKLFKKNRKWHITLQEVWPVESSVLNWTFDADQLQTAVEWTDNVLFTWTSSKRESWDTWSFDSKKNAEKFITYYNIACPQ